MASGNGRLASCHDVRAQTNNQASKAGNNKSDAQYCVTNEEMAMTVMAMGTTTGTRHLTDRSLSAEIPSHKSAASIKKTQGGMCWMMSIGHCRAQLTIRNQLNN